MFDSKDYLYCNHASCGRRFCSESALDKHCLLFHGRPTCDLCGGKLKKSSKHRCSLLDSYLTPEDYPALDFMSDSDMEYYYEAQLLEEDSEQAMAFSLFDVAGHDQVFSEEETLRGRSGSEASLYSHDGYKDSQEVEDAEDDVDIYYDDLAEDCDYYRDSDYGTEYDTKVASPIPLPVYLSQALTRLIEEYGDVMPCYYDDTIEDDADSSSGSDRTYNEDFSDPESEDQVPRKDSLWSFGELTAEDLQACNEIYL